MPCIRLLGYTHLVARDQLPDFLESPLPSCTLSCQALRESVAKLSPALCPSVAVMTSTFLHLSARMVGCGSLPPSGVTVEKV